MKAGKSAWQQVEENHQVATLILNSEILELLVEASSRTVWELRSNARFARVSRASVAESHPHDVTITNEAPNYAPPERKTPEKEE